MRGLGTLMRAEQGVSGWTPQAGGSWFTGDMGLLERGDPPVTGGKQEAAFPHLQSPSVAAEERRLTDIPSK